MRGKTPYSDYNQAGSFGRKMRVDMSYGVFDDATSGDARVQMEKEQYDKKIRTASYQVTKQFGDYFKVAESEKDFDNRFSLVGNEIHSKIAETILPTPKIVRQVRASLKGEWETEHKARRLAQKRQAAAQKKASTPTGPDGSFLHCQAKTDDGYCGKVADTVVDGKPFCKEHASSRTAASRKSSSWYFDSSVGSYRASGTPDSFTCGCGKKVATKGLSTCDCGKVWNGWSISSSDKTASGATNFMREVKRRDVVLASRRVARKQKRAQQEVTLQDQKTSRRRVSKKPPEGWEQKPSTEVYTSESFPGRIEASDDGVKLLDGRGRTVSTHDSVDEAAQAANFKSSRRKKSSVWVDEDGDEIDTESGGKSRCPQCGEYELKDGVLESGNEYGGHCLNCDYEVVYPGITRKSTRIASSPDFTSYSDDKLVENFNTMKSMLASAYTPDLAQMLIDAKVELDKRGIEVDHRIISRLKTADDVYQDPNAAVAPPGVDPSVVPDPGLDEQRAAPQDNVRPAPGENNPQWRTDTLNDAKRKLLEVAEQEAGRAIVNGEDVNETVESLKNAIETLLYVSADDIQGNLNTPEQDPAALPDDSLEEASQVLRSAASNIARFKEKRASAKAARGQTPASAFNRGVQAATSDPVVSHNPFHREISATLHQAWEEGFNSLRPNTLPKGAESLFAAGYRAAENGAPASKFASREFLEGYAAYDGTKASKKTSSSDPISYTPDGTEGDRSQQYKDLMKELDDALDSGDGDKVRAVREKLRNLDTPPGTSEG